MLIYIIIFSIIYLIFLFTITKKQKIISKIENEEIKKNIDFYNLRVNKIFTKTEMYFFRQLKEYIKNINKDLNIFTKVRIADIVKDWRYNYYDKIKTFNKINRKHVDFILSDDFWNIKLIIELDWYSHNNYQVRKNDEMKNELFQILKIPFIRYKVKMGKYDFSQIKEILN